LKGYLTNIDANTTDGLHVVAPYHELYQVERSFRMAKSDLAARPIFHRIRDSIEAHLTIVFAALAVSREASTTLLRWSLNRYNSGQTKIESPGKWGNLR
jgi:transposase